MSAETNFNIGDYIQFQHNGIWKEGTIVAVLDDDTVTVSWYDLPTATSYLSSTKYENIKKITNN